MRILAWLLTAGLLMVSTAVPAAQVHGLFRVDEELLEPDDAARDVALGKAFASVVWRLSGIKNLNAYPQLKAQAGDPQALITGYTHRDSVLSVQFDAASLLNLLREQEVAVLGMQRPMLLLWWSQQDLHGQQLLGDGHTQAENIVDQAAQKGLPVRFPLADLQEQMLTDNMRTSQLSPDIEGLLERYASDAFVRVVEDGNAAQWTLVEQDRVSRGQVQADNPVALNNEVFRQLAEHFINRYAVLPGQGEQLRVQVNGLDAQRFALLENLLSPYGARLHSMNGQQGIWLVQALPEQLRALFAMQRLHELPVPEIEPETVVIDSTQVESEGQNTAVAPREKIDLLFGW